MADGMAGRLRICFHCNPSFSDLAFARLEAHCEVRKYKQRAQTWFGVSISPNADLQFGLVLKFPWVHSEVLEQETKGMKTGTPAASKTARPLDKKPTKKVGRNDLCSCGSGRKFKKCCLS